MIRGEWVAVALVLGLCLYQGAAAVSINEIRIDQFGVDNDQYFELEGSTGESLDDLWYVVLGDSPAGVSGTIEAVIPLTGLEIPDDGFFLAAESSFGAPGTAFDGIFPDLSASLNFENSDNVTHVLVSTFTGNNGDDLDIDDDGTLDITPWGVVVDAVGLVESPDLSAPNSEWYYGTALNFTDIGPSGTFVPGHVYRENDAGSDWVIGEFSLDVGDPNITIDDTPGVSNTGANNDIDGDFDDNGSYECFDIDSLVAVIAAASHNELFDITQDGLVNLDDLIAWLAEAADEGGLTVSGEPLLIGDANLDGNVDGTDYQLWSANKFSSLASWCAGDFNADGHVDGRDLLLWNSNKFQSAAAAVPEPGSVCGWLLASCLVFWSRRSDKRHSCYD